MAAISLPVNSLPSRLSPEKIANQCQEIFDQSITEVAQRLQSETLHENQAFQITPEAMDVIVASSIPATSQDAQSLAAAKIVRAFFRAHPINITPYQLTEDRLAGLPCCWLMDFIREANENFCESLAEEVVRLPGKENWSCYHLALDLADPDPKGFYEFEDPADVLRELKRRSFQAVAEPLAGDLVMFLQQGRPRHLGIYQKDGLVLSKWGCRRAAYLYRLEDVLDRYGTEFRFYRKQNSPKASNMTAASTSF